MVTGMLGAAWQGADDVSVMVEVSRGLFPDRPDGLVFPIDATVWAFRFGKMAMKQKLKFDLVGTAVGVAAQYGWLARAELGYDIRDGLKASVAATTTAPDMTHWVSHSRPKMVVRSDPFPHWESMICCS